MSRDSRCSWWPALFCLGIAMAIGTVAQQGKADGQGGGGAATLPSDKLKAATEVPSASAEAPPEEEPAEPDSPRAAVSRFIDLVRTGQDNEAARYLDVPKAQEHEAGPLARHLLAVLDRLAWVNPETLSPRTTGDLEDGLPPNFENVATIPGPTGSPLAIRLVRRDFADPKWVFSRATVEKIDASYERLEDRWLLEHMPAPLLRLGPRHLLRWQWLALPLLFFFSAMLGEAVNWAMRWALTHIVKRTRTEWDNALLQRLKGPTALAWTLAFAYVGVPVLVLYKPGEAFVFQLLRAGFFFCFFWILARVVDVGSQMVLKSPWSRQRQASRALISLVGRVGKFIVVAVAVVAFLSELGYPVESLIAGLGIGGLAIALAAQKTVENLFGAFSIGADQPFREGDFVRFEDVTGTVESIGLRSTKVRTLDRTLVTVPNGKLSDTRIESFAARDRIRFSAKIRIAQETTAARMRQILDSVDRLLKGHPKIWQDGIVARFSEISDASLDIEMSCWFATADWSEFQLIRQNLLLDVLRIVEELGASLGRAQTVRVLTEPAAPPSAPLTSGPR